MGKAKEEAIEVEGRVKQALPNTTFRVDLDIGGEIMPTLAARCESTSSRSSLETV